MYNIEDTITLYMTATLLFVASLDNQKHAVRRFPSVQPVHSHVKRNSPDSLEHSEISLNFTTFSFSFVLLSFCVELHSAIHGF